MFPLGDVIPPRTTPWVTYFLIAANVAAWLLGFAPDWFVVAANAIALWVFGGNVEDRCGHGRFLVLYIVCGGIGASAQGVVTNDWLATPVAASAATSAVSGIMAAYFVLFPKSLVLLGVFLVAYVEVIEVPAVAVVGTWGVAQILGATITVWAIVLSALAGALGVSLLKRPERQRVDWWG